MDYKTHIIGIGVHEEDGEYFLTCAGCMGDWYIGTEYPTHEQIEEMGRDHSRTCNH